VDLDTLAHWDLDVRDAIHTQRLLAFVEQRGAPPALAHVLRERLIQCRIEDRAALSSVEPATQEHIAELEGQLRQTERHVSKLKAQLRLVQSSRSWRLTAPLRGLGHAIRR
jgi:hypothetical protein